MNRKKLDKRTKQIGRKRKMNWKSGQIHHYNGALNSFTVFLAAKQKEKHTKFLVSIQFIWRGEHFPGTEF